MGAKVAVLALALEADTEESFSPADAVVCDVILIWLVITIMCKLVCRRFRIKRM